VPTAVRSVAAAEQRQGGMMSVNHAKLMAGSVAAIIGTWPVMWTQIMHQTMQ